MFAFKHNCLFNLLLLRIYYLDARLRSVSSRMILRIRM